MRWRRDDRQQPDDHPDVPAEEWLSQFRPVRPDALTSADRDATGRPTAGQPGPGPWGADWAADPPDSGRGARRPRRDRTDSGRAADGPVQGGRADSGSDGRQRRDNAWGQLAARPSAAGPDREPRSADHPTRAAGPDQRHGEVRAPGRQDPAEFPAERDYRPPLGPDRSWREGRSEGSPDDTASQRPVADWRRRTGDDRPDYGGGAGTDGLGRSPDPRPLARGFELGPDPRRPAYDDRGSGLEPPDPRRSLHDGRGPRVEFVPDLGARPRGHDDLTGSGGVDRSTRPRRYDDLTGSEGADLGPRRRGYDDLTGGSGRDRGTRPRRYDDLTGSEGADLGPRRRGYDDLTGGSGRDLGPRRPADDEIGRASWRGRV